MMTASSLSNRKFCNLTLLYVNLFTCRLQSATNIKVTKQQLAQTHCFHYLRKVGTYLLLTVTGFKLLV